MHNIIPLGVWLYLLQGTTIQFMDADPNVCILTSVAMSFIKAIYYE